MYLNLIKSYINIIKKEDIKIFLNNNNIYLNDKELDYAYYIVKNKYELIINNDNDIFYEIKNNISKVNYEKLLNLYNKYKGLYL